MARARSLSLQSIHRIESAPVASGGTSFAFPKWFVRVRDGSQLGPDVALVVLRRRGDFEFTHSVHEDANCADRHPGHSMKIPSAVDSDGCVHIRRRLSYMRCSGYADFCLPSPSQVKAATSSLSS